MQALSKRRFTPRIRIGVLPSFRLDDWVSNAKTWSLTMTIAAKPQALTVTTGPLPASTKVHVQGSI
ncbi:hypothetical protein, partial [Mycoplana dimorpha]|uniref:hypothetical protein n=1 Tax=Mycoplana dimorpha TaxID=28320 RepID=UPI0035BBB4C2